MEWPCSDRECGQEGPLEKVISEQESGRIEGENHA